MSAEKYLKSGRNNTLLLSNGIGFETSGQWVNAVDETELDRWYVGAYSHAEYSIVADYDFDNKEIIRCLVTATPDAASLVVYGRSTVGEPIVDVIGSVNDSYFSLKAIPKTGKLGCQVYLHRHYYQNNNLQEKRT